MLVKEILRRRVLIGNYLFHTKASPKDVFFIPLLFSVIRTAFSFWWAVGWVLWIKVSMGGFSLLSTAVDSMWHEKKTSSWATDQDHYHRHIINFNGPKRMVKFRDFSCWHSGWDPFFPSCLHRRGDATVIAVDIVQVDRTRANGRMENMFPNI